VHFLFKEFIVFSIDWKAYNISVIFQCTGLCHGCLFHFVCSINYAAYLSAFELNVTEEISCKGSLLLRGSRWVFQ